jgi:hypothetical protein
LFVHLFFYFIFFFKQKKIKNKNIYFFFEKKNKKMSDKKKFTPDDDKKILKWVKEVKPTFSNPSRMDWKGASLHMFHNTRKPDELCDRYNKCLKFRDVPRRIGRFTKTEKLLIVRKWPTVTLVGRTKRQISRFYVNARNRAILQFGIATADVTAAHLLQLINGKQ